MDKKKIDQRIRDLRMHLSLPWKEEAKAWAWIELAALIAKHGEPEPEFKPKQLTLF